MEADAVAAIFAGHQSAEAAVKKLADVDFKMTNLSIFGKGSYKEKKVVGFRNVGGWVNIWGKLGAIWVALCARSLVDLVCLARCCMAWVCRRTA